MSYKAYSKRVHNSTLTIHGVIDSGTNAEVLFDFNWSLDDAKRVASRMNQVEDLTPISIKALLREGARSERASIRQELEETGLYNDKINHIFASRETGGDF